jgi:hypothetical protein
LPPEGSTHQLTFASSSLHEGGSDPEPFTYNEAAY